MKKFYLSLLFLILSVSLAACGDTENKDTNDTKEPTTTDKDSEHKEGEASVNEDEEMGTEDVEDTELGKLSIAYKNKELNETTESGPMKLSVTAIQLANLEVAEDYKEMFDNKDKVTVITVEMKAENTTDETISFYPDQATLTTDTGDQQDADMLLSDSVGGDFFGKVNKEGNVIFIVKSPAEEIGEINLIISGSHDEEFENQGEDVKLTIPTK